MTTITTAVTDNVDPILGDWELLNHMYTFTESGDILLYDEHIAVWQHVVGRKYLIAYLRGCAWRNRGASDVVEIVQNDDGEFKLAGFFSDWKDWDLDVKRADAVADPHSIVGSWQSGGSLFDVTEDHWIELCGARLGVWRRLGDSKFLCVYCSGHLRGVSEGLLLDEGGQTARMTHGDFRQEFIRRADARAMSYRTSPFDNAIVRIGTVEFDVTLGPIGADNCQDKQFVAFEETFPDDRLEDVAVVVNNQTLPTVVADVIVAKHEGRQGFWLRVCNVLRTNKDHGKDSEDRDESQATVNGTIVLSWLAVLGNAEPHELSNGKDFEICMGKLPAQPRVRYSMVEWPTDYTGLFGQRFHQCEIPLSFFTSDSPVNCAARVSRNGIEELTGYNTDSQATGKTTLFWVAIARRPSVESPVVAASRNLWIDCGVSHLVRDFQPERRVGDWANYHRPFKPPFSEPPHTQVTSSGLNVEGHQACIVGMAFHQELKSGNMKGRSCDVQPGRAGFSWIAFGPVADEP